MTENLATAATGGQPVKLLRTPAQALNVLSHWGRHAFTFMGIDFVSL